MSDFHAHIAVRALSHRYGGRSDIVLDRVSFEVQRGERLAVIGRSGCGKSTLLQIIAGLVHPATGEVTINGRTVTAPSPRCNLMFQRSLLFPWLDVAGNVALALRFVGQRNAQARVAHLLQFVGLRGYERASVTELSGGQQQRVALARAIISEPKIVLADEPTGNLDSKSSDSVLSLLRQLNREIGQTIVMITHNPDAATYGNRVLHMRDGLVVDGAGH